MKDKEIKASRENQMEEHCSCDRELIIIVNGRQRIVTEKKLSYTDIVELAFDNPPIGPNILFTITYRNGPRKNPEGNLLEGITIKIKKGMIFNVTSTDKS